MYKIKKRCGICQSSNLKKIISLPKFPLTGIFVKKKLENFSYYFDQKLNICKKCGHIQLNKFISRENLYNNLYANRTSASHLSDNSINFFKNFLNKCCKKKQLGNILEIGCNDIKLLKILKKNANHVFGIDPIWKSKKNPSKKKFKIIGDFVENVNFDKKIKERINIFLTTHNLEHIENPYKQLKKIVNYSDKETLFFIEVPDSNLMVKNLRFDQVFHQHYHYFNLNSLENLVSRLNCKIIKKSINHNFWGGSLMIAFKKSNEKNKIKIKSNFKTMKTLIFRNYKMFKKHYKNLYKKIKVKNNLVGYGAGQMVPSFAYHLDSNLSFLKVIIDDNKQREGFKYKDLNPKIKFYNKDFLRKKTVLITALDGVKSISKKLKKQNISVINPLPRHALIKTKVNFNEISSPLRL